MITTVLKFSEIKKDPVCLLGWDRPAVITRYGDVVAYVLSPERMMELLDKEKQLSCNHSWSGKSENQYCSKCGIGG